MPTLRPFTHLRAASVGQAVRLSSKRGKKAAVIAGGTDLLGVIKDGVHPGHPEVLIDIKPIAALRGVREDRRGLRIGALCTLGDLARHEGVRGRYPLLAQAARAVASPQIRNMGTVGGNLCQEPRCWYYRTPDDLFHCLRKGGDRCGAILGDNRYHSIFGATRTALPVCSGDCPAHVAIPLYLAKIREGDIEGAARLFLERNPLPAITGRVCPHYCQSHCNRCGFDEAVSTRAIERRLGDHVLANAAEFMKPPKAATGKKVAIVGAGPGGLAAAYYLRRAGHHVTVLDRMPEAGGMLRFGIPAYRLPLKVVRTQVRALAAMGIKFVQGVEVGKGRTTLRELRRRHDAVFIATGAWRQRRLGLEHEELLHPGLEFLIGIRRGRQGRGLQKEIPGKRVLVIGGGNVAVDVAVSARRLGARDVTIACLESRERMPVFPEDLDSALEEKIALLPSWGPHRVLAKDGVVTGMELVRCTSAFDREGRFRPAFDPSVKTMVETDVVLLAIGQGADLACAGDALEVERGMIVVDGETQATSLRDVYAGGDAVTGASTIVSAIAAGRRAAAAIDAALRGRRAAAARSCDGDVRFEINVEALKKSRAARAAVREGPARTIGGEDAPSIDWGAVEAEADRCANCGCVAVNASDLAPALCALNAIIRTNRRAIPAEEFFAAGLMSTTVLLPGELVTEVVIPAPPAGSVQGYEKFRIRNAIDFPIVGVATVLSMDGTTITGARVVFGAVAAVPRRAREVEEFLVGKAPDEATAETAGAIAVRGAMPLGGNRHKIQIVKELLRRAIVRAGASGRMVSFGSAI